MRDKDLSQIPVVENGHIAGSITETAVLSYLLENPLRHGDTPVGEIMGPAFPEVEQDMPFSELNKYISRSNPAVITRDATGKSYILTKYDIIQMI